MTNQAMGTKMGNPTCDWVRAHLPLWVDVRDDLTERNDEGADLRLEDQQSIGGHLRICPSCRDYRASLERSSQALASVAAGLFVEPDTPSLWPSLEQRIAAHDAGLSRPWLRTPRPVSDKRQATLSSLDGDRPLQSAWLRDSLGEILAGSGLSRRESPVFHDTDANPAAQFGWSPAWLTGSGIAAAILALLFGLPALRRQFADAETIIQANTEPIAISAPVATEAEDPAPEELVDDREIPSRELAQADPVPAPPPSAPGHEATPTAKNTTPARWNFDLEHGTPMPPDARDAKPVY